MHHKPFNSNPGFTIIELLVVVVVIGILATIVVLSGTTYIKNSAETTVQSNLQSAATEFRNQKAKNGSYPVTQTELNNLVKPNENIALTLVAADGNDFCLSAMSIKYDDITYYMGVDDNKPTTTNCISQVASEDGGGGDDGGGDETPPVSLPFAVAVNSKTCGAGSPGTYNASITLNGTAGESIQIMVANGFKLYTNSYATFTIGTDGTVTGNITGSYDPGGGTWSVYASNYNTDPMTRVSAYLCS